MAKQRNRKADLAVYLVARLLAALVRALPFGIAVRIADGLAFLAKKVFAKRNRVARDNLLHAFPGEYNDAQIDRLLSAMYRHFFRMMVEIVHLPHLLHLRNWRSKMLFASPEQYRQFSLALFSGRPVMMVTGHFGNWELLGFILGRLGFPGWAIARPLDNPYVDRWLRSWREATGQKLIAKNGEFELIEGALRDGRNTGNARRSRRRHARPIRTVLQSAGLHAQGSCALGSGAQTVDDRRRGGPHWRRIEIPGLFGRRHRSAGLRETPGRRESDHRSLHGSPGANHSPASRAVLLAASSVETSTAGGEEEGGGMTPITSFNGSATALSSFFVDEPRLLNLIVGPLLDDWPRPDHVPDEADLSKQRIVR